MQESEEKNIQIKEITTSREIRDCFPVLTQLRDMYKDEDKFVELIQRHFKEGYKLACLYEGDIVKAVAGYRFFECLAWGKVLYIDDLVTDNDSRSKGYGGVLMEWVIDLGRKEDCDQVHLDSNLDRIDAHRFYLKHKFDKICFHFSVKLK